MMIPRETSIDGIEHDNSRIQIGERQERKESNLKLALLMKSGKI